jgi:protoporphyrinogen oxidase
MPIPPEKTAVIIGAGPAGLTAAYELLKKTSIKPIIYEATSDIGGISKTVKYKGNRIDIGGHRFFSKNAWVMEWWEQFLPTMGSPAKDDLILKRNVPVSDKFGAPDPETSDRVMLIRQRISRIFFLRSFFDYPVSLNFNTLKNLGVVRLTRIGFSYLWICLFPIKKEKSLEDFFINRFGGELYRTFFKDYTEKVWGVPCREIKPEWGAQRIKGLSITKAILHALKSRFSNNDSIAQKETETSLIEQFFYPKFGPGQLWETVAEQVIKDGGEIRTDQRVVGIKTENQRVVELQVEDLKKGSTTSIKADYFFSTMPIKDLVASLSPPPPRTLQDIANKLCYRDFITVGILAEKLLIENESKFKTVNNILPDNWIYIQERDVKLGRLQIFNNWSPYLVADSSLVWVGLEYFCNEGDDLWNLSDEEMAGLAKNELAKIGIVDPTQVVDSVVIRIPKAYPAYFGSYDEFPVIRQFLDPFDNLLLIGRNGMHRYNNMDHSMLTAKLAVDYVRGEIKSKDSIWNVNAEEDYHEEK